MFGLKVGAAFAITAFVYWAGWVWATLPFGSKLFLRMAFVIPLVSLIALGAAAIALAGLLRANFRRQALRILGLSLAVVGGTVLGMWSGPIHKMQRIRHVAPAAMPLVRALESFEQREHRPPKDLTELVPAYMAALPSTGMGGYSEWEYITGPDARDLYDGNAWVLVVFTGGPGINFDKLMYFPNQRYPQVGHGGWIERIGAWGYVHE